MCALIEVESVILSSCYSLTDTMSALLNEVKGRLPLSFIAVHCHDTRGTALFNILTALQVYIYMYSQNMIVYTCVYTYGQKCTCPHLTAVRVSVADVYTCM